MNLLLTSVGSNTAISVIKALKRQNQIDIKIFGTDLNDFNLCPGARMVDEFIKTPNVNLFSEYKSSILSIIKKFDINCVIPIHDLEIEAISKIKVIHSDLTYWAVNDFSIIHLCNDKTKANTFALQIGLNVPNFFSFEEIKNITSKNIIAKPNQGVSSRGIFYIENSNWNVVSGIDLSHYILQEVVEGVEYTVDCFSNQHGVFVGGVVRERIETKSGISVKGRIVKYDLLINAASKFLNKLKYKGASNLQFIVSNDIAYFIEINPRFSGSGILSYVGGFNSPLFTILEVLNMELPDISELNIHYGLSMSRYWEEVFSFE